MTEWKGKNKNSSKYNFWHSPLALGILFFLIILFAYNMIGLVKKERETNRNKASELNKIEELRKREQSLTTDIDKLNTDQGIEESIRDKFQVVKPGEKMVVIIDEKENTILPSDTTIDHSFWGYIKRMFKR